MKLTILGIVAITSLAAITIAQQSPAAQTSAELIKVRGCLKGNGSDQNPWALRDVVLPSPRAAAPAAAPGGRGDGGGRGGGRGRGDGGGQQAQAGDGAGGAGRGGDGGRGAAAAPAPPPQPAVDLRLSGVDLSPWRNMFVEVEGTLGPRPGSGPQEFRVDSARSAYGDCR
jgi:hypothetical protein